MTPLETIDREFDSADPTPQSILQALAAAGYAVVPVEPTEAMYDAGAEARKTVRSGGAIGQTIENMVKHERRFEASIYRAMIAAAKETGR